jgi:hypothetical protein
MFLITMFTHSLHSLLVNTLMNALLIGLPLSGWPRRLLLLQ